MSETQTTPELSPLEVLRLFRMHDGSLDDFFASRLEREPGRICVVAEERSWSWAELSQATGAAARWLVTRGVGRGERVVVMGRNSIWQLVTLLALARIGAVMVPINPGFKVEEASYIVAQARASGVLCDEAARPVASAAASGAWIEALGPGLIAGEGAPPASVGSADDVAIIIYTSGTTGRPKGAMHSQASLIAAGEAFVERMHLQPDDRLLTILPMFHINAMFYSVAGALAAGATLLIEPRFSASGFWRTAKRLRATQVNMIEAVATILLSRPPEEYEPDHSIRKVYGARDAIVAPLRARFGIPHLIGGYAMTEIPGVLSTPFGRENRKGSMGMLCRHPDPSRPWARCRIVDDEGRDVPDGEAGELIVDTPIVMKGYFDDPEQSAASFRDGWFLTGDLVRRDAEGFYYFVSRKKDIIRKRGENIAGAELDLVVGRHPQVLIAAAIGVPSRFGDDDILIAVRPKEGAALKEADIVAWCREHLAPIKVPHYVVLLDEMPLTPTHKVAKAALREQAAVLIGKAVEFG
ncbi:class I adenylate-forming enzyme family protein [Microvirga sp. 2TAF3]|uniref:class I adenylate-forming enzyme family protein n=1 Tax=Microvirga sp. 2TAF3 TaxID=3233014 RepID=UPI003F993DF1